MKLHVLTAVTRPQNLPKLARSLARAATPEWEIDWRWRFDPDREHVGGQALKNQMLGEIEDGWVWVLDDDTVAHPKVLARVAERVRGVDAVVVSQKHGDAILAAGPGCARLGHIDIGMAFLTRELIGEHRLPEEYDGDGKFLSELLERAAVSYIPETLSYYNKLRA